MTAEMDYVRDERPRSAPPQAVVKDASEFLSDLFELVELQAALIKEDASRGIGQIVRIAVLLLIACVIGLSCVPIAMAAAAHGLHQLGCPLSAGFAIVAAVGGLAAAALAVIGWRSLKSAGSMFARSKHELSHNISWLKKVVAKRRETQPDA